MDPLPDYVLLSAFSLIHSRTLSGADDPVKGRLRLTKQDNDGNYPTSRKAHSIMLKILPIMLLSSALKSSLLCSIIFP